MEVVALDPLGLKGDESAPPEAAARLSCSPKVQLLKCRHQLNSSSATNQLNTNDRLREPSLIGGCIMID